MFLKTSIGYELGCVRGALGPARLPLPDVGCAIMDCDRGWNLCRVSEDVMVLADCFAECKPKDAWSKCMTRMHGILLRRLGKKRVVYLVRQAPESGTRESSWHSNVNLVTGVSMDWLDKAFKPGKTEFYCTVAGMVDSSSAQ